MKKIMLVGKTGESFRELSTRLSAHYTVRSGTSEPIAIFAILKSFRPDLIVVNTADVSKETLSHLGSECGSIPIVAAVPDGETDAARELHAREICMPDAEAVSDAVYRVMPYSPDDKGGKIPVVLVIDDDAAMLRMIKVMIEDTFDPVLAPSGAKALRLIERKRPDVILLDFEMPEMNGIETLERLRADESTADIPVIFLTGSSSPEIAAKIEEMHTAGFLIKPADAPDIKAAVNKALKK